MAATARALPRCRRRSCSVVAGAADVDGGRPRRARTIAAARRVRSSSGAGTSLLTHTRVPSSQRTRSDAPPGMRRVRRLCVSPSDERSTTPPPLSSASAPRREEVLSAASSLHSCFTPLRRTSGRLASHSHSQPCSSPPSFSSKVTIVASSCLLLYALLKVQGRSTCKKRRAQETSKCFTVSSLAVKLRKKVKRTLRQVFPGTVLHPIPVIRKIRVGQDHGMNVGFPPHSISNPRW
jgi:hypothetical protein